MNLLRELLAYLEGNDVSSNFVDYMLARAKVKNCVLYRCILGEEGLYKIGDIAPLSKYSICSGSNTSDSSLAAAKSFAKDTEKSIDGLNYYVLRIDTPLICVKFGTILRYLTYFDNFSYTKNIVIPRLKKEQESIMSSKSTGVVISIH